MGGTPVHGLTLGRAAPAQDDGDGLADRIARAYRLGNQTPLGSTESMWLSGPLLDLRRDVHDALLGQGRDAAALLRDPGKTDLFHGFEDLTRTFQAEQLPGLDTDAFVRMQYLGLLELARATGAHRVRHHDQPEPAFPDSEELLAKLDAVFGFRLTFPNPFPDEIGLATSRGIVSYRAPPAVYQAWRMRQLVEQSPSARVLEIGAGLGRTAFYARQFGLTDYTIVDLPISLAAQANFLGRVVSSDAVHLYGERRRSNGIKLLPPSAFLQATDRYELVLNVDSLTEMAKPTAQAYCDAIAGRCATFLSINHEGLPFTVAELIRGRVLQRTPYWMRPGYVEEISGTLRIGRSPAGLPRRIASRLRLGIRPGQK